MTAPSTPVTIRTLREMARVGTPFACLTCYDATMARWLAKAGVHVLLVGDTAAEVILGHDRTIDMPMDVAVALTAGVKRGAPACVVMADMPFMSYQADDSSALRNAARFMTKGKADVVKIEADASFAPLVEKMTRAGIPLCAHVGSKPQHAALTGGYRSAGKTPKEADQIVADAVALERAGSVLLLVEAIPDELTARVLAATTVPVIGIGAGPRPHAQVLVLQDLLGMTENPPKFAPPLAAIGSAIEAAAKEWCVRVASRRVDASNLAPDVRTTNTPAPSRPTPGRP